MRVHRVIAQEVEDVSVELVRAGLGDDVDGRAGVGSVARGQGAGLDAELLDRVRERQRHVQVGELVDVVPAIQQIAVAVHLSAGDGNRGVRLGRGVAVPVILTAQKVLIGKRGSGNGGAGKQQKLRYLPSVKRQIDDSFVVNDF